MRNNHGFSLIEILITLLIFKIGVLGVIAGQTFAVRQVQDAIQRLHAISLIASLANKLAVNSHLITVLGSHINIDIALPGAPDCDLSKGCNTEEIAVYQANTWFNHLTYLSQTSLQDIQVCLDGDIAVRWQRKSTPEAYAARGCEISTGYSGFSVQGFGD